MSMTSPVVHEAINRQINAELGASYAYLAMSAFCSRQNFHGCAHWLRLQSQEEYGHAMKLYDFLLAREARESILPRFALTVIDRYFPGYEAEIRRHMAERPPTRREAS